MQKFRRYHAKLQFSFDDGNEKKAAKAFGMTLINQDGTELAKSSIALEEGEYSVQKISTELKQGTYYVVVKKESSDKSDIEFGDYSVSTVLD